MERWRQRVLPEEQFAPEAVQQFIDERPDLDDSMREILHASAETVVNPPDARKQRVARAFLQALIGFPDGTQSR